MAQAVSRRPLIAGARIRSQVSPCEICGGQIGTVVLLSHMFVLGLQYQSRRLPHRAVSSRSSSVGTVTALRAGISGRHCSIAGNYRHFPPSSPSPCRLGAHTVRSGGRQCEGDHSLSFSAEIRTEWSYAPSPPHIFMHN